MALLAVERVSRDFGGVRAVDAVSLELLPGELRAVIGPNGCGKSTLFRLIAGADRPSAGRIVFDGVDITALAARRIARMGIGRKFQVPWVFEELTVAENLVLGGRAPPAGAGVADEMECIGLAARASDRAGDLSHRQRQWLEIGIVLASRPRLLLLDEPTAGMTDAETRATVDLLRRIASTGDVAILVTEHDVGFLEQLDCAVTAMARGRVLRTGTFAEVRSDPAVRADYFGDATGEAG